MTTIDDDPNRPEARQLLEGTGSLAFEGQEFRPTDGGPALWLQLSDQVRSELARQLGVDAVTLEGPQRFYLKFHGRIHRGETSWGYGHLDCYPGAAIIDELIEARMIHTPDDPRRRFGSIRALLRAPRQGQSDRSG